jgi:hypothetical protein
VDGEAAAMTRAIGILMGALLMSGVFLLVLSAGNSPTLVKEVVSSEVDTLTRVNGPAVAEYVTVESAVDSATLPETNVASLAGESQPGVKGKGFVLDPQSWNESMADYETADLNDTAAVSRYQVWSPFHSEWAAQGFARRLALATDVPMEVVNEAPGNYQVVFNYRDDGERQMLIRHIETVTGLELE